MTLHVIREKDGRPARCDAVRSSADGSDFLSAVSTRLDAARPRPSVMHAAAAAGGAMASSCSTRSDGGFAEVGECNEDVICPLCGLCDDNLRDGPDGASVGVQDVVLCKGCQGGFRVTYMCAMLSESLRRRSLAANHPAAIEWSTEHMQRGAGTWRCAACVKEGRWGVSHLIESAVTFSDAHCISKSATYSVLVKFHADGAAPEPRFLHGRAPHGCADSSEIQDPVLYKDLCVVARTRMGS